MHGGTSGSNIRFAGGQGLSPHARGNLVQMQHAAAAPGSIPACTGEPWCAWFGLTRSRVYPRMHGGTTPQHRRQAVIQGLSPHARGNQALERGEDVIRGSIPACTGEPVMLYSPLIGCWVYPRMHGGTAQQCSSNTTSGGLSPHARGNRLPLFKGHRWHGSIPACTGEPLLDNIRQEENGVYPRMHGGTTGKTAQEVAQEGLSPHARGNL